MTLTYRGSFHCYSSVPCLPPSGKGASALGVYTTLLAALRRQTGCVKTFGPSGATSLFLKALKTQVPFGDYERQTWLASLRLTSLFGKALKSKACLLRCARQAKTKKPKSKGQRLTSPVFKSF